jgi:hypothetical protein
MPSSRSKHHKKDDGDLDSVIGTADVHDTADVETTESIAGPEAEAVTGPEVVAESEAVERSIADALSPIASVSDTALFSDILGTLREHINSIKGINIEYVLLGIAIAIYLPALAWLGLAYLFALPSLLCIQHSDWLFRIRKSYFILLPIVLVAIVSSDVYAIYCLAHVFY